uniref:Dihydroxyacetone phosphate acyltransferase-like n=2 Tax=Hirondellea gigas TaxID=1518452 RepID=A0A6A7G270_9CRUS
MSTGGSNSEVESSKAWQGAEYEDVLGERRGQSDLRWAAQEWQSSGGYKAGHKIPHNEIVRRVIDSERVQQAIRNVSKAEEKTVKQVEKEIVEILQTMGHKQDISAIRKFAFALPKIMKTICDKLIVHRPSIERLREVLHHRPVVLLPTHRSYADFLLVSYLAFHYNLPLPLIAAGMDFINMAYIGNLLREAGAFYIRRSFMEDELYWAVFQEYVHVLVCCESAPMEFFLEGTRSRTGKSLRPKLGLLGTVCQCCWLNHTEDVLLVPMNISYSRTLEENLYAYEMLGIPKPKESTSGLFKATKILSERYGNIFIHIGEPVSVRSTLSCSISQPTPATATTALTAQQIRVVESLGVQLVRQQQKLAVVSTFSVASHVLLAALQRDDTGLHYDALLSAVTDLLSNLQDPGPGSAGVVMWEGHHSKDGIDGVLRASLSLHSNVISVTTDGALQYTQYDFPTPASASLSGDVSVLHMLLQHYANQSIHAFVRPALLLLAMQVLARELQQQQEAMYSEESVKARFSKLCSIFGHEFIIAKECEEEDYNESVSRLVRCGGVERMDDGTLKLLPFPLYDCSPTLMIYNTCLKPFLLTHTTAINLAGQQEWINEAALVSRVQQSISSSSKLYSALSLDSIRNAVRSITKHGGLTSFRSSSNGNKLVPNSSVLQDLHLSLTGDTSMEPSLNSKL